MRVTLTVCSERTFLDGNKLETSTDLFFNDIETAYRTMNFILNNTSNVVKCEIRGEIDEKWRNIDD